MTTDELVRQLADELTPSPRRLPLAQVTALWLVATVAYVTITMLIIAPFRPGVLDQLITQPRFALENAVGLLAVLFWTTSAFSTAVPGAASRWYPRLGVALVTLWLADFILGFLAPALEPSMTGKRTHCALEAYLYSIPPTAVAIWLQLRRYPLKPVTSAMQAAMAAALFPAVLMQVACMYAPAHILQQHVLPVAIVTLATGVLAYGLQRWLRQRPPLYPSTR